MRILFISPVDGKSSHVASYLGKALQESPYSLQYATDFREGIDLAQHDRFDAVLIVALDTASITALTALLPRYAGLPGTPAILVVLSQAAPRERVGMLRAGADACFVEPCSFVEIQERMLALCRTIKPATEPGAAALRLDAATRELVEGEKRIGMTKLEYLLIECLLRQPDAPVERETVIRYAWPDTDTVDPSSVNLVASRVRRKLEEHHFNARVETINRFGYQINTKGAPPSSQGAATPDR